MEKKYGTCRQEKGVFTLFTPLGCCRQEVEYLVITSPTGEPIKELPTGVETELRRKQIKLFLQQMAESEIPICKKEANYIIETLNLGVQNG